MPSFLLNLIKIAEQSTVFINIFFAGITTKVRQFSIFCIAYENVGVNLYISKIKTSQQLFEQTNFNYIVKSNTSDAYYFNRFYLHRSQFAILIKRKKKNIWFYRIFIQTRLMAYF